MKKLVLFANSTWCIHNFRLNLMRTLLARGCEVHVFAPLDPTYANEFFIAEFEKLGIKFHEIPFEPRGRNPLKELKTLWLLFLALRRVNPDTVLSFTVKCNLYAGFCRQILGFQQIANVPGLGEVFERRSALSIIVSCLYRLSFRGMSRAFFQNSEDLKFCLDRKLVPSSRCSVIPGSGVDLSRFQPFALPRSSNRRVFLMFGRLLSQKGYLEFLSAAATVKELLGSSVEFWVMGIEDKNRHESAVIKAKLEAAASAGVVRMVPMQIDVVPTLANVDAIVLPSRYNEGIPRSLLEGLASGKAIITTDWRGCRETVEDGKNGYLVPVNSVSSLVQAMLKIAEMPAEELRKMGQMSRSLVVERFDESLVILEYDRVIQGGVPARSVMFSRPGKIPARSAPLAPARQAVAVQAVAAGDARLSPDVRTSADKTV